MKVHSNLLSMLAAVFLLLGGMAFFVVSFSAKDLGWFLSGFKDVPVRVVVYHGGQKTEYSLDTPGYKDLAEGVRSSLDSGVARLSSTGLSAESLQETYTTYTTVEAFFDHPVKLHAWFFTGNPTQMLIPVSGRHSEDAVVFLAANGMYWSGPPILKTKQPLLDALIGLGYSLE